MRSSSGKIVLFSALGLALFSTLFSIAAWNDWWPRLPEGALHDTDLWAGFVGAAGLLIALIIWRKPKSSSPQ